MFYDILFLILTAFIAFIIGMAYSFEKGHYTACYELGGITVEQKCIKYEEIKPTNERSKS